MQQMQPYAQQGGYPQQAPGGYQQQQQPGPPPMHPQVQEALTQIDLLSGEQVMYSIIADGFFLGANPVLKMIAAYQAFMMKLMCGHNRIFLIVTNQRVLIIRSFKQDCLGANTANSVLSVALSGVKEVGSERITMAWCFNTRSVQLQTMTQTFNLVIKQMGDHEIRTFITNLAAVMVAQTNRAGV